MSDLVKEKKIININSNDATLKLNGSFLSNLSFAFKSIVSREDDVEYIEGGVDSAVFAVSFYIINYSNNIFNYTILHLGVYTSYSITVPVGNYDYITLFSTMRTLFLANGHNILMTISEVNGCTTIVFTPATTQVFYSINHSTSTIFRVIGFDVSTNYFPTANTITAPFPLNLLGIKKLKIFCPQLSSYNLDTTVYGMTDLILTIINDQPPFGQINYYNNSGDISSKLRAFDFNTIEIRITDEFGQFINFNNADWSITLALNTFRRRKYSTFMRSVAFDNFAPDDNDNEKDLKDNNEVADADAEAEVEPLDGVDDEVEDVGNLDELLRDGELVFE
jgi:hypothetical protein